MIKRNVQIITSKFGWRWNRKNYHKGIDLRSWTNDFKTKLPIILPEDCKFLRRKYEKKWGWTLVFEPLETAGYCEFKFTHIEDNDSFIPGYAYSKKTIISHTIVTDYMKKKKFGDHLHFATLRYGKLLKKLIKRSVNPEIYFEIRDIPKKYA